MPIGQNSVANHTTDQTALCPKVVFVTWPETTKPSDPNKYALFSGPLHPLLGAVITVLDPLSKALSTS
jgi:hypothetical protein